MTDKEKQELDLQVATEIFANLRKYSQGFYTGNRLLTRGIADLIKSGTLSTEFVNKCWERHIAADYGDMCREDVEQNNEMRTKGGLVQSSYRSPAPDRIKVWIITDPGWENTTMLLPDEY